MMEIKIVGWHLPDAPYTCDDCGKPAAYLTTYKDDEYQDTRDICRVCAESKRYSIVEDQIAKIFKDLGL